MNIIASFLCWCQTFTRYVPAMPSRIRPSPYVVVLPLLFFTMDAGAEKKRHRERTQSPAPQQITEPENPSVEESPSLYHPLESGKPVPSLTGAKIKPTHLSQFDALGLRGPCDRKPSLQSLGQISTPLSLQASPSGGVYFLSDSPGEPQLFFLKSPQDWPQKVSSLSGGTAWFKVSPDGKKILLAAPLEEVGPHKLFLHSVQEKKTDLILSNEKELVSSADWLPSSAGFLYTQVEINEGVCTLAEFLLEKKSANILIHPDRSSKITDISPNGKYVALTSSRSYTDSEVKIWNIEKKILQKISSSAKEEVFKSALFTGDSESLLLLSDKDKGMLKIFIYPLNSSQIPRLFAGTDGEIDFMAISPDRTKLIYLTNDNGYSKLEGILIDPKGRKRKMLFVPNLKSSVIRSVDFEKANPQNSFFYIKSSSIESPDIWLWNHPHNEPWTKTTVAGVHPPCFIREQLIHFNSFDNRKIPAFLYIPKAALEPKNFIIYIHDGPNDQFRPSFNAVIQYALIHGFGVLAPNIRGSSGYGREYSLMDDREKRPNAVKDIIAGAQWLIQQRYARSQSITLYGIGYGGLITLRSLQMEPKTLKAGAVSDPVLNIKSMLKGSHPFLMSFLEAEYGTPHEISVLETSSPIFRAENLKSPILFLQTDHISQSSKEELSILIEHLNKNKIPVELVLVKTVEIDELSRPLEEIRQVVHFSQKHNEPVLKTTPVNVTEPDKQHPL